MRQIILDTETTGLDPKEGHRIIEFAGLEMVNRKLTGNSLHLYIQPEREIDPAAQNVHGISLIDLEGKPLFVDIADEIIDFIKGAELIIHNAQFDVNFLNHEFASIKAPSVENTSHNVVDTLKMARDMFPGKRNNLDALCDRFDIDRSNRTLHGALIDCALLADVYLAMTRDQLSLNMGTVLDDTLSTTGKINRPEFLAVLKATAEELQIHEDYLDKIEKQFSGPCVYRQ